MTFPFDSTSAIYFYLLTVRIGALFVLSPILSNVAGLTVVRVLLVLVLSALMVSAMPPSAPAMRFDLSALVLGTMHELVIGAVLAFGVAAAFAAFSFAGNVLDVQTGFSLGAIFNPLTGVSSPVLSTALSMLALTLFFSLDGHHALVRGIAYSVQQVAPGASIPLRLEAVASQFGMMFTLALAMIAPVFIALILTDFGLAFLSRVLPQINILVLGISVKVLIGTGLLAISLPVLAPVMARAYASIFEYWQGVLPQ